jgi:U3 small nucleolar RNA-associated protein 21
MTAITGLRYSSTSDLAALSCDDLSIRIIDVETRKVIREFWGCRGQINDFSFSNDGRWIIAASMDSIIRVWDLATGHLIDVFQLPSTCTALAFSGTGEFLATAHADGLGINVWNNKSLFLNLPPKHIDENDLTNIGKQTASDGLISGIIDAAFTSSVGDSDYSGVTTSREQLDGDMMTLSIVPRSTWQTLLHLDAIKVCLTCRS